MSDATTTDPNERYRTARWFSAYVAERPEEHRTCDCCGAGLKYVNLVSLDDGEVVALGNDCVERVGLSTPELKKHWAAKFAEVRAERARHRHEVRMAEERAKVNGLPEKAVLVAYWHEARAEAARRGLPEWTPNDAWREGTDVRHDFCPEAVMAGYWAEAGSAAAHVVEKAAATLAGFAPDPFRGVTGEDDLFTTTALFDLAGNLLDAALVRGKFGPVWRVAVGPHEVAWFNASKARNADKARAANAAKGYYVGLVAVRMGRNRYGETYANLDGPPVAVLDNGLDLSA